METIREIDQLPPNAMKSAEAALKEKLRATAQVRQGDWRIGAPFYFCAALQTASSALAFMHFRRQPVRTAAD